MLTDVRKHVPVEFVLLGKSLLAKITLVWLVTFMNSLMILEVRAFNKALITEGTLVWFNTCHTGIMITFALLVTKDFTTYVTFISFWGSWYYYYVTAIVTFSILILFHSLPEISLCLITLEKKNVQSANATKNYYFLLAIIVSQL